MREPPPMRRNFFFSPSFLKFLPFGSKFSKLGSKLKSRRIGGGCPRSLRSLGRLRGAKSFNIKIISFKNSNKDFLLLGIAVNNRKKSAF